MPLLQVWLDPNDATGSGNTAILAAAAALATEGIEIQNQVACNVRASASGYVIPAYVNKTISGFPVAFNAWPATRLNLIGTDGSVASIIAGQSNGFFTGVKVKHLWLDGGRAGGWGTGLSGACISMAGQNDYSSTAHGVEVYNVVAVNGLTQQLSVNSINGFDFNGLRCWATTNPMQSAHGLDVDAVAVDKPSKGGRIRYSYLDSYGQESMKFENATDISIEDSSIQMYVTLTQDNVDVYSELARISFARCEINAPIRIGFAKRRGIPLAFDKIAPSNTLTLSGSFGTPGANVTTSGYTFSSADVGRALSMATWPSSGGFGVITSVASGNATVRVLSAFASGTLSLGTWLIDGKHLKPAATLSGLTGVGIGASATVTGYQFQSNNVGQMIGFYSGLGSGAAIITAVTPGVNATATVIDTFSANPASGQMVMAWTDNSGSGDITFSNNKFGMDGCVMPTQANYQNYGQLTFSANQFSEFGNSYKFPASTPIAATGNTNAGLPLKRFCMPTAPAKYNGLFSQGIAGLTEYTERAYCGTDIKAVSLVANTGEIVVCRDGVYVAPGASGVNRGINCNNKAITIRAENCFKALIDLSAGSGYIGVSSATDIAGSLIWGFVFYGAGIGGGNGAGISITGGSLTCRMVAAINCKTLNNGSGIRISGGSPTIEDYWIEGNDLTTTQGALYLSAATGTPVLRRGVVRNNTGSGAAVGARLDTAGAVVDGLEVVNNTGTGASTIGGISITKTMTLRALTAANNTSGATAPANDVSIATGITVTGSGLICRSNGGGRKPLNATSPAGVFSLDKCDIVGWVSAAADIINGITTGHTLTNIIGSDPLFLDSAGGNYSLKPASPCNTGPTITYIDNAVQTSDLSWDFGGAPFLQPAMGAWAYQA